MTELTKYRIIGRKDIIDFPELNLFGIDVKIDTGAYTSSFHCHFIKEETQNGVQVLKCNFLDPSHPEYNEKEMCFSEYSMKKVKSSNGMVELRFKVSTNVLIFGETKPIELTLTERGDMKYSVLLGRKFLKGNFLVDVSKSNLSYKLNKKKLKI